tara:strand:+ start:1677 stop:1991 length:315 start_codon:yes stop_codon:yes gene_type:complete
MSSAKWENVNGVRHHMGFCQSHKDGLKECEGPEYTIMDRAKNRPSKAATEEKESFVYEGREWVTVREISLEEAIAIRSRNLQNVSPSSAKNGWTPEMMKWLKSK